MAKTQQKELAYGGFYDKVEERVYYVEKTALFGLIRWREIVHTDQIANTFILQISTTRMPDKTYVNGEEYLLVPTNQE